MNDEEPEDVELRVDTYAAGGGTEHFISVEDFEKDLLVGFCRLRFPNAGRERSDAPRDSERRSREPLRRELQDGAIVRELHVYGSEVAMGDGGDDSTHQHKGWGRTLLAEAEDIARDAGYEKLSVISGIGVREYYREKLGYFQDGPYVSTRL